MWILAIVGGLAHSAQLSQSTQLRAAGHAKDKSKYVPYVTHLKVKGNGYAKGSPLYDKQQATVAAGVPAAGVPSPSTAPAPSPTGKPTPMFTEDTMPAVAPTLQCVISLTIQYFLIYTALAVTRTLAQFTGGGSGGGFFALMKILEAAATTVTYAPMLSVLFLGVRMRAIQLSQGQTEKYQLPQPWVQQSMYVATYCVLAQVILVLIAPIFSGEAGVKCDSEGNLDLSSVKPSMITSIVNAVRYVVMLALYISIICVCVGAYMMEAPKEIWGEDGGPPVSPAVACTMNLTWQFFAVYLGVALSRTMVQVSGPSPFLTKIIGVFTMAKLTVNFAPMLCILFIGARMRALQMDPKNGNPQLWAQRCFYLCTYSVMIQALLCIFVPLLIPDCVCKQGSSEGDVTFESPNQTINVVLNATRYFLLLSLYVGFTAVMVSVFIIEHPTDVSLTPPISPAMQCVMNLTVQYFTVYLLLFIAITVKQFAGGGKQETGQFDLFGFIIGVLDAGRHTVMFAPMLSMLFIGARMRALQLTKATDGTIPPSAGPQPWAQQAMFLATWSVMVQLIMAMVVPIATGTGKPEMDEDGNVKTPAGANKIVGIICDIIKYLCLISMYGGACVIVYAVYTMTPESLPPYCEDSTLIPGVTVPNPPTPPTPGF
jgi:hypothetical protein